VKCFTLYTLYSSLLAALSALTFLCQFAKTFIFPLFSFILAIHLFPVGWCIHQFPILPSFKSDLACCCAEVRRLLPPAVPGKAPCWLKARQPLKAWRRFKRKNLAFKLSLTKYSLPTSLILSIVNKVSFSSEFGLCSCWYCFAQILVSNLSNNRRYQTPLSSPFKRYVELKPFRTRISDLQKCMAYVWTSTKLFPCSGVSSIPLCFSVLEPKNKWTNGNGPKTHHNFDGHCHSWIWPLPQWKFSAPGTSVENSICIAVAFGNTTKWEHLFRCRGALALLCSI